MGHKLGPEEAGQDAPADAWKSENVRKFPLRYLKEAYRLMASLPASRAPEKLAVLHNHGQLTLLNGNTDEALGYFEQAQRLLNETYSEPRVRASILQHLSLIAAKKGNSASAAAYLEQAKKLLISAYDFNDVNCPSADQFQDGLVLLVIKGDRNVSRGPIVRAIPADRLDNYQHTSVAGGPHDIPLPPPSTALLTKEQQRAALEAYKEELENYDPSVQEGANEGAGKIVLSPEQKKEIEELNRQAIEKIQQMMKNMPEDVKQRDKEFREKLQNVRMGGDFAGEIFRRLLGGVRARDIMRLIDQRKYQEAWEAAETDRYADFRQFLAEHVTMTGPIAAKWSPEDRRQFNAMYPLIADLYLVWLAAQTSANKIDIILQNNSDRSQELKAAVDNLAEASRRMSLQERRSTEIGQTRSKLDRFVIDNEPSLPAPPSLEEARQSLRPGDLYMAFSIGEDKTHIFLVRRGEALKVVSTNVSRKALNELVNGFRRIVTTEQGSIDNVYTEGRKLYSALFPGEAGNAVKSAKRLIISPEGFLWNMPFSGLVMNTTDAHRFLGVEKSITYVQSLSLLDYSPSNYPSSSSADKLDVFAVGISRFPGNMAWPTFKIKAPWEDLPNARSEAEDIAKLYKIAPVLDDQATEEVLRRRLARANIIHLATHGFAESSMNTAMLSGILLSLPSNAEGANNDGVLRSWEVLNQLTLNADLVVLSACETGLGLSGALSIFDGAQEIERGDGFGRMVRAFQVSGASAVVASQWKVSDDSTRRLMVSFHRNLLNGLEKDEALRQAMIALQQNRATAHPFYWAPFVLVGNPRNVKIQQPR
jgi:CHAT domain-containing protein